MADKEYLIKESTLTSISQAIKNIYPNTKLDKMSPLEMPEQIQKQVDLAKRQRLDESINSMGIIIDSYSEREFSDYVDGYEFQYNDNTEKYEIVYTHHDVGYFQSYRGIYVPYTTFYPPLVGASTVRTPGWKIYGNTIIPDN